MKINTKPSVPFRRLHVSLIAALVTTTVAGCAGSPSSQNAAAGSPAPKEYRPPRVETTGSLISRAVVAHVDDDDDTQSSDARTRKGANTVSELLNGNSALQGTRAGQIR